MPDETYEVLERAWDQPFALASNFAREFPLGVALSASLGWISIVRPDGRAILPKYHITAAGVTALEAYHRDI